MIKNCSSKILSVIFPGGFLRNTTIENILRVFYKKLQNQQIAVFVSENLCSFFKEKKLISIVA